VFSNVKLLITHVYMSEKTFSNKLSAPPSSGAAVLNCGSQQSFSNIIKIW